MVRLDTLYLGIQHGEAAGRFLPLRTGRCRAATGGSIGGDALSGGFGVARASAALEAKAPALRPDDLLWTKDSLFA